MDTGSLGLPRSLDRKIRSMLLTVDTFAGAICEVRYIHDQDGKAWIQMSKKTHMDPLSKRHQNRKHQKPLRSSNVH